MRKILLLLLLAGLFRALPAQDDSWRDQMEYLIYTPRYFGPNAFPLPELTGGSLSDRWEVELRGDFHTMTGDRTKDLFARLYIPIAHGRAGITVSGVIQEWYKTSEAVRDERHAVEVEPPIPCRGDIVVNCYYQVLRSDRWADVVVSANIKTASGGRLCDARYTDAASYWFTAEAGRTLWADTTRAAFVRAQGLAGFYCWMTNDMVHRQNDALCYGIGLKGGWRGLELACDFSGLRGYRGQGDRPVLFRSRLSYELRKNVVAFGYKRGLRDYLYDSFSIGYTRCF